MIQAHIRCDRSQPPARCRAVAQVRETLVGFQENFLSDVFRFGPVGGQAQGSAKYHVLVVPHEYLELLRICHRLAWGLSYGRKAAGGQTVASVDKLSCLNRDRFHITFLSHHRNAICFRILWLNPRGSAPLVRLAGTPPTPP